jgi:predicted DNA-binding protein (UPF0278 family)
MRNNLQYIVENANKTMVERIYSEQLIVKLVEHAYKGHSVSRVINELRMPNSIFMEALTPEAKYNEFLCEGLLDSIKDLYAKVSTTVKEKISKNKERVIGWAQGATLTSVAFMILLSSTGALTNQKQVNIDVDNKTPIVKQLDAIKNDIPKQDKKEIGKKIYTSVMDEMYQKLNLSEVFKKLDVDGNNDVRAALKLTGEMYKKLSDVTKEMLNAKYDIYDKILRSDVDSKEKEEAEATYEAYKQILDSVREDLRQLIKDGILETAKSNSALNKLSNAISARTQQAQKPASQDN